MTREARVRATRSCGHTDELGVDPRPQVGRRPRRPGQKDSSSGPAASARNGIAIASTGEIGALYGAYHFLLAADRTADRSTRHHERPRCSSE